MKKLVTCLIVISWLCGCTIASKTYTSDGKEGYNINCSGSMLNWGMCYEKAGDICGSKGFIILERSGDRGAMLSGNSFGLYAGSVITRNLIITCKDELPLEEDSSFMND